MPPATSECSTSRVSALHFIDRVDGKSLKPAFCHRMNPKAGQRPPRETGLLRQTSLPVRLLTLTQTVRSRIAWILGRPSHHRIIRIGVVTCQPIDTLLMFTRAPVDEPRVQIAISTIVNTYDVPERHVSVCFLWRRSFHLKYRVRAVKTHPHHGHEQHQKHPGSHGNSIRSRRGKLRCILLNASRHTSSYPNHTAASLHRSHRRQVARALSCRRLRAA